MIEIYTDGACLGNPGPGGWGAVIVRDDKVELEISGQEPRTTNNRMEITAVIEALRHLPSGEPAKVLSDSEYVIKTQTLGWQKKANLDLWAALDRSAAGHRIEWAWVQGHAGNTYNELANRLAQNAAAAAAAAGTKAGSAEGQPSKAAIPEARLTHIDESGKARMVDVGGKDVTERVAVARALVVMKQETLHLIKTGGMEKGDVIGVARLAGVMAAKKTHELIPLCHPIPLTQVTVEITPGGADRLEVSATAKATWKTGVEMEALTAASVAALTVYDMCKAVDRGMRIEGLRLVRKTGGKSGDWVEPPQVASP